MSVVTKYLNQERKKKLLLISPWVVMKTLTDPVRSVKFTTLDKNGKVIFEELF